MVFKRTRLICTFLFLTATGAGGYPRPGMIPSREAALGLHHPDLLGRPYADQLAHQVIDHVLLKICDFNPDWETIRYKRPVLVVPTFGRKKFII